MKRLVMTGVVEETTRKVYKVDLTGLDASEVDKLVNDSYITHHLWENADEDDEVLHSSFDYKIDIEDVDMGS